MNQDNEQNELNVKRYEAGTKQGNASDQYQLGQLYLEGTSVEQDHKQAFKWFKAAAEQDNAYAQYQLGNMYSEGIGVEQDFK